MSIENLAWDKMGSLIPAIVQDAFDGRVLMQGYMNKKALDTTLDTGRVTFWSRSRECLWTKGETSGHYLDLVEVQFSPCAAHMKYVEDESRTNIALEHV